MSNNEQNPFDLPRESNNDNQNTNNINSTNNTSNISNTETSNENKTIIEIPQSYYDKVAKEQQEKAATEARQAEERVAVQQAASETQGILFAAFINAIIIFGGLYCTVNISLYIFIVVPVALIFLSLFFSFKDREKNNYPASIMVGGIIGGVLSFVISMLNEDTADLYMYFAIACTVLGFAGFAVSSIIQKYVTKGKEIKALETIGYLIFFAALVGVPYWYAKKNKEEFYKIIFHTQVEVEATTEDEFVKKTMKARYNIEFTCKKTRKGINENSRPQKTREECTDSNGHIFNITSIAYNEGSNQYVVTDTYLDSILINPVKKNINETVKSATNVIDVTSSLYPEENCFFYGDCVDCDEYFKRYAKENDIERQYTISSSANYEKYLNENPQKFVNDRKFKYIINIYGSFNDNTYKTAVDATLKVLNDNGYKNNFGFIINLYNVIGSDYDQAFKRLAYKVKGETNSSKLFGSYESLPVSG